MNIADNRQILWSILYLLAEVDSILNISVALPLIGEAVQLAFLQLDHAGSHCQPWGVRGELEIKLPGISLQRRVPQAR